MEENQSYKYFLEKKVEYFKELALDDAPLIEKLKAYIMDNIQRYTNTVELPDVAETLRNVPELAEIFRPWGLTIKRIYIITMDPGAGIHRDKGDWDTRINIPIINCEYSTTKFFTGPEQGKEKNLPNGIPYTYYNPDDCVEVASFKLRKTTLFRIKELHQVVTDPNYTPRISCSLLFDQDINFLWNL